MKLVGTAVIIIATTYAGISVIIYKKKQIRYFDMLILICERLTILLEHSMPETSELLNTLRNDKSLEGFDFSLKDIPVNDRSFRSKVNEYFSSIGRFDAATQIMLSDELSAECRMIKEKYQQEFDKHYRLYLAFGVLSGIMLSLMII